MLQRNLTNFYSKGVAEDNALCLMQEVLVQGVDIMGYRSGVAPDMETRDHAAVRQVREYDHAWQRTAATRQV